MAASSGTHNGSRRSSDDEPSETNLMSHERQTNHEQVSKQLLYPDKYGECYKEEKLTIVRTEKPESRVTFDVPQSSVLSRLKDFLPQMSMANKDMATQMAVAPDKSDDFNIEHIGNENERHIEMNLSMIPPELVGNDDSSTESDENSSESLSNSSAEESDGGTVEDHMKKPRQKLQLPSKKSKVMKPTIEELEDQGADIFKDTKDR